MNHRLLIATNNQGKVRELQEILSDLRVELVTPAQIGLTLEVEEDGFTYEENAAKKALAFAHASRLIALADDSGLKWTRWTARPGCILRVTRPRRAPQTQTVAPTCSKS